MAKIEVKPSATPATAAPVRARTATVLLTGVGGIVGQGMLKSLAKTAHRLIGVDSSELAAGLYATERGYLVPPVQDPAYADTLLGLCVREGVKYVFSGLDMELPILARVAPRFRERGVTIVISSPEVVDLSDDKLATVRFLESRGLAFPRTVDLSEGSAREFGLPVVLKPRRGGSRSQGVFVVRDERELDYRLSTIDVRNYVAQEFLDGDEFSAGSLTFEGRCMGAMVMRRTLRDGDTHKAFVFRDPAVDAYIARVAEELKPFGPCNFQFRMRRGVPYIFEINPRISGGACMRALAGFNEALMTIEYLENGTIPAWQVRPVSVFRYWKEMVVEDARIEEVRRTGGVKGLGQNL
jgi:carbamoyl-phosphate synthase large subunit